MASLQDFLDAYQIDAQPFEQNPVLAVNIQGLLDHIAEILIVGQRDSQAHGAKCQNPGCSRIRRAGCCV